MRPAVYPALVAAWLVLVQWRQLGATRAGLTDLLTSLGAALLTALVGWGIACAITKDRDRRALIALLVVCWVALYSTFAVAASGVMPLRPSEGALLWTGLIAFAMLGARHVPTGPALTHTITSASVILLAMQGVALALTPRSATVASDRPVTDTRSAERPDIYIVILDKYTSSAWLRTTFGVDNGAFEDSLRALGFALPAAPRTNYTHTGLVLASMFNGVPVHETITDADAGWPEIFAEIEDARYWGFLRERGYRFFFAPTTYKGTERNRNADRVLVRTAETTRRVPLHTWQAHAPFRSLRAVFCAGGNCSASRNAGPTAVPFPVESAVDITWKFETTATLPDSIGPIVSLTHILAPHDPYQFDADCRQLAPWWPQTDVGVDSTVRAAYAAQVQCVNRMVLRMVTELVERSEFPPIIVLQGDHGHGRFARDIMLGHTIPRAELPDDQFAERLSVFAAYRTPGLAITWPDSITPLNVLTRILNARFGTDHALHPDRSWWVDRYSEPLRLEPVESIATPSGTSVNFNSSKR